MNLYLAFFTTTTGMVFPPDSLHFDQNCCFLAFWLSRGPWRLLDWTSGVIRLLTVTKCPRWS